MIKVAVGSKNNVKIKAVENIFKKVFGNIEIQGIEVDSGVSHTPSSWDEIAQGAISRAKTSLQEISADFGVGLEGGYEKTKFGVFMTGAVAIVDKNGKLGISKGKGILLPTKVVEKLEHGQELGDIMDELQGVENTKQKWGAVGFFTKNYSNRQESFESAVLYALARFLRKELYEE
jgi:inosine/xanthosine triphosphatase